MWLYIGFCIALFVVVKPQSKTPDNEPEEIFVDVIKNISRVNNVLQELISNYETLQKIYKSQENIDSSKYSDSDMDEVFEKKKKKSRSQTSKATKKEKFAATEMYWSDHEEETKDDYIKQSKKGHTVKGDVVEKDKNFVRQKHRTSTTTIRPEESSSSEASDSEESVENVLKMKIEMSPQYAEENNNKAISKSSKAISKSSKAISKSIKAQTGFEDSFALSSLQKYLQPLIDTKPAKTRSRKIYKTKEKSADTGLNSSHLIVSDRVKEVHISHNPNKVKKNHSPKADDSNNLRTHNKIKISENLTTKTSFYDLIKDTPIVLETHSDIFMENVKNPITNRDKKNRNELVTHKNKRRDSVKLKSSKHSHEKEDIDKVAANATHHILQRAENVRGAKDNDTQHKTKKYIKKIDDDTQIINDDHKKASIDHKSNNKNHKTEDNDKKARSTDNYNKKTQDDTEMDDIGYKKISNENKKTNKRHKKADVETETMHKDHKMVNNNEEKRGTEMKSKEIKKTYKETQVNHEESSLSSDESVLMDKNETNVLREAYGEACMKVVVRKCFKACKKSLKSVCSQTKCKSSLKSAVKKHAKTGCLQRFTAVAKPNPQNVTSEHSELTEDEDLFTLKRRALQENFTNLNAGGFHVCLPTLGVQAEPTVRPSTNETDSTKRKMNHRAIEEKVSFNILRDRFERACKKLSYKKCHGACKISWDSACSTYDCSKRLKSLYKKHCKNDCKNAYGLNKKRKDSDDSNSDSDDSSDSS